VMRVIRENKESLMAVLEAFIHDPLLNWRLNTRESPPRPHFKSERRASIIDVPNHGSGSPGTTSAQPGNPYRHRRSSVLEPVGGGTLDPQAGADAKEVQNARALQVLARVKEKLTGRDFGPNASSSSFNSGINGLSLTDDLRGISSTSSGNTELIGGLQVSDQVDWLLRQATDVENLCQHYIGWCSFW
jgi:serine/threonine-protein kinase mTOR